MFWENYFFKVFAIDMSIQWAAWGIAAYLQTEKFYDITGKCFPMNDSKFLNYLKISLIM